MSGLAIVTGASSGIGREIARQLAARGRPVLAVARRLDRLEELAAEARANQGATIHTLQLDVTRPESAFALRDRARALGGAEWLVNDAGQMRVGPVSGADPAQQAAMVRLNCEAPVAICAAIVPDLVARKAGVVLNVASLAGMQPTPFFAAYGASKAFLITYTEALREELRGTGVSVTALCPGPVATELVDAGIPDAGDRKPPSYEIDAAACARAAIDAAERGRMFCIPGAFNRVQAVVTAVSPRPLVRRVARRAALKYLGYDPSKHGA
jgi:short-subunit dehydrogenase